MRSRVRTRHLWLVATLPNHYTTRTDTVCKDDRATIELLTVKRKKQKQCKRISWQWMNERTYIVCFTKTIHLVCEVRRKTCFLISISAVIFKLMVKITSIFGSYRFLRIAWHDIFPLSDHFPASWNLHIPRDLAESNSKCSFSRQSNPEVNHRTHLKDYCVS